jgi:hypothetical protein
MAKKYLYLLISCMVLLCGCNDKNPSNSSVSTTNAVDNSSTSDNLSAQIDMDKIDFATLTPTKSGYSEYDNKIEYYTSEEAEQIVVSSTDFHIPFDCYLSIPKTIDHVSTFTKNYSEQDELYDFYRSYLEMYKYLFPNEVFDDNNLFYFGANSNNQESDDKVKTIGNNFSEFISEDKKDVYFMFYSSHFYDGQPASQDKHNHFLELSSPIGTIMTNFNKGYLADYVSDMNQTPNDYFLETYTLPYVFSDIDAQTGSFVGFETTAYPTDSDTSYTMLDGKSLSVSDAVAFFEDYVNTLPCSKNPNLDVMVTSVSADEINDGKYCYAFDVTITFEGIPFDYMPYGTYVLGGGNEGHESSVRMGYMAVSDDVDAAYGFCRYVDISERNDAEQIVSFESALKCCSESMSDFADWELRSAELVYCAGNGKTAVAPYQDTEYTVSPNYKFILYNANDDLCYSVYVDAISGEFVRYYKTRG